MPASPYLLVGSLLLAASSWAFYHLAGTHPEQLFLLYGLVGLCVGVVGAVPYVMVRAFPPEVRFTGISFSYNVSYAIFGGLTPISGDGDDGACRRWRRPGTYWRCR